MTVDVEQLNERGELRHLINLGLLDREHLDDQNWYWRAGGRVTGLPSAEHDQ